LHLYESVWFAYPYVTRLSVGLIFGEMVSRLILAHMLDEEFPLLPRPLKIMLGVFAYSSIIFVFRRMSIQVSPPISELNVLIFLVIATNVSYFSFVSRIVRDICKFLKISVLSIPKIKSKK